MAGVVCLTLVWRSLAYLFFVRDLKRASEQFRPFQDCSHTSNAKATIEQLYLLRQHIGNAQNAASLPHKINSDSVVSEKGLFPHSVSSCTAY